MSEGIPKKHLSPEEFDEWFKSLTLYQKIAFKRRVSKSFIKEYANGLNDALDDFKDWLDEAKKEYPGVTKIFNAETRTVNITLPDAWFKKRFGDDE